MKQSVSYETKLLHGWEDVFKKGQLTLWIMLALKDGPKHTAEIKVFINQSTNGLLSADDQSMYRALRRYVSADLVSFAMKPSKSGPDLKVYSLTDVGLRVLDNFVKRNITGSLLKPNIIRLLEGAK